jgi:hypothetical protein
MYIRFKFDNIIAQLITEESAHDRNECNLVVTKI